MGQYTLKLLELVDLFDGSAKIRMSIDQQEKLYLLQLDRFTYDSLVQVLKGFDDSLTRLSLITKRDPFNNTYISSITVIKGKESRKLTFNCSEEYVKQIEKIKAFHSFEGVSNIHYLEELEEVTEVENNSIEITQMTNETNSKPKKAIQRKAPSYFKSIGVAAIALISIILFTGEYFSAKETNNVQLAQGSYLLALPADKSIEAPDLASHAIQSEVKEETEIIDEDLIVAGETEIKGERSVSFASVEVEELTYHLPKGYVALTFDDGPSTYTKQIVDLLSEHEVAGTFFFVGAQAEKFPELVTYTDEKGHTVASHSKSHKNLTQIYASHLQAEIFDSIDILNRLSENEVNLFRPPYGAINDNTKSILSKNGIKTVMWNRDPRDWEARSKETILQYFYEYDPSGGIYILHENEHTLAALPEIIKYLKDQELIIVGLE